jgi:chemotaxis protein CheY-P-specific phosphatase CheC
MNGLPKINEDQRDCLQEIVNVAMGQAGESLACLLEVFVQLGVPRIHLVACDDITPQLTAMIDAQHDKVTAVRQAFYRSKGKLDIQGEALLVFSDASLTDLTELMSYEEEGSVNAEQEVLLEVSNILNGACLTGIAEQLESDFGYSAPSLIGTHLTTDQILSTDQLSWQEALMIEITYRLENRDFKCNLMFLMTGESIQKLINAIDEFLEEL